MTSLKAISTLLSKSKLLLFIVFITASPLFGDGDFRVLVQGESEEYVSLLETVLSSFSSVGSDEVLSLREERRSFEEQKAEINRLTEESRNEKWSEEKEGEMEEREDVLSLETVSIDLSSYSEFLREGNEDAYCYLKRIHSIDAVFYVRSEDDGGIERIEVLLDGRVIHSAWYNSSLYREEEGILFSLLSSLLLSPGYSLYHISLTPGNAALLVDGSIVENDNGYVILEKGTHNFSLSSYGFKNAFYSLELDGKRKEISLCLEEDEPFILSLTTYPFDAELNLNGTEQSSHTLSGVYVPYVITLDSTGFCQYTYQEREKKGRVTLHMEPQWMERSGMLGEKKASFYSSLFYVLLSFGGYAASGAVSSYYSESAGSAMEVVFTGSMILSLVNLFSSAVDYYNTARTGL